MLAEMERHILSQCSPRVVVASLAHNPGLTAAVELEARGLLKHIGPRPMPPGVFLDQDATEWEITPEGSVALRFAAAAA